MTSMTTCLALASALILTAQTTLADGKFYSGSNCRVESASHSTRASLTYHVNGMALNNSTTERLQVTCPIIRDSMASGGTVRARVFVIASNDVATPLACELREVSTWGQGLVQSQRAVMPERNSLTRTACNNQIVRMVQEANLADPDRREVVDCSLYLQLTGTDQWSGHSGNWSEASGTGYVLACALPPRDTTGEINGRSGIGGYYVLEDS